MSRRAAPRLRSILGRAGRAALRRILRHRPLLAFDYDGTLAPLVTDPAAALLPRATHVRLRALAQRLPCIVVSGRQRAQVARFLRRVPLRAVVGNHGGEAGQPAPGTRALMRRWHRLLTALLSRHPGAWLEDKRLSLTLHVRPPASLARLRRSLAALAPARDGLRVLPGKRVLNLVPATAPDKGLALAAAMARLGCLHAVFIGDDHTDEDAFRRLGAPAVVTVRVGRVRHSRARWRLLRQADMDRLLDLLLALAPAAGSG